MQPAYYYPVQIKVKVTDAVIVPGVSEQSKLTLDILASLFITRLLFARRPLHIIIINSHVSKGRMARRLIDYKCTYMTDHNILL